MRERTSGVVLAGGTSTRFGSDKRVAEVDGRPMLLRAIDAVSAVADDALVATPTDNPIPRSITLPPVVRVVPDVPHARGPLAGLLAGLQAARHPLVVVLACDHPWARAETLVALRDQLDASPELDAVVASDGRPQPLVAAYRADVQHVIRTQFADDDVRAVTLLDHLAVRFVDDAPGLSVTVRDVDTPADLDAGPPPPRARGRR